MPIFGKKKTTSNSSTSAAPVASTKTSNKLPLPPLPSNNSVVSSKSSFDGWSFHSGSDAGAMSMKEFEFQDPSDWTTSKELQYWSTEDVIKWLSMLQLEEEAPHFEENGITGADLIELTDKELSIDLKVSKLGHRKRILRSIQSLKAKKPFDSRSFATPSEQMSVHSQSQHTFSDNSSFQSADFSMDDSSSVVSFPAEPISVKCYHHSDIRVVEIDNFSFEELKEKVNKMYRSDMLFKYTDADGELVTMYSDNDLKRAWRKSRKDGQIKVTLSIGSGCLTEVECRTLEAMVDSVIVIDAKGLVLLYNKSAEQMFGFKKKHIVGHNVKRLMADNDAKNHKKFLKRYQKTGKSRIIGIGRNVLCKHVDGSEFYARLSLSETKDESEEFGSRHFFTGVMHRVDEKPPTSASLSPATDSMFAILDSMLDATIVIDSSGMIMFFNKAASTLFGYTRTEMVGKNVKVLMPQPFRDEHDSYLQRYMKTREAHVIGIGRDVPIECKDGSILRAQLKISEQQTDDKMYFTGVLTPNLESKVGSKSVLEAEREVLNSLPLPAMIIDARGTIQAWNSIATKEFGYLLTEVLGKNVNILMSGPDRDNHNSYIDNYMKTGKAKIIGIGREVTVKSKDGSLALCKLWVTEKSDGNKKYFSGVLDPNPSK